MLKAHLAFQLLETFLKSESAFNVFVWFFNSVNLCTHLYSSVKWMDTINDEMDSAMKLHAQHYGTFWTYHRKPDPQKTTYGRDVQSALIGRQYVTECDGAPVQYNGIV